MQIGTVHAGSRQMAQSTRLPSTYEVLRSHGIGRRDFLSFCTATAAAMGLEAAMVPTVVAAMENKPRIPVIWLHGLGQRTIIRPTRNFLPIKMDSGRSRPKT